MGCLELWSLAFPDWVELPVITPVIRKKKAQISVFDSLFSYIDCITPLLPKSEISSH